MYANFVAKIDVSEVEIAHLQEHLPTLARLLESRGDCMYEIDYTQDFSGMVDRNALVSHLRANGFEMQGSGRHSDKGTILDNTSSVGDHVCTWIHTDMGHTARTKIYNKVVSQFEAGEVNDPFGGHLADYVDCPNQHMRRTFVHPAVQARGCTRIEVSYYGSKTLSARTGEKQVAAALEEVQVENEENGLFVVQPPARQWENLTKHLNCCFLVADRSQETLWMGWSGNTKTGTGANLSPEEIQEIVSLRGVEAPDSIRKRFGIGTSRMYKIWKKAEKERAAKAEEAAEAAKAEEMEEDRGLAAVLSALDLLYEKMDLLLEGQEIHFEDVKDLEEKLDEAQKGIEEGSNALEKERQDCFCCQCRKGCLLQPQRGGCYCLRSWSCCLGAFPS